MTRKLYYEDAYQTTFKATVRKCEEGTDGYKVLLDQTCFYPEGGGQQADKGMLGAYRVKDVFVIDDEVYHLLDSPFQEGEEVEGKIDFEKRIDAMRQHTAEHILAGVIDKDYGYSNVGFHLSEVYTTADFDGSFTEEQVQDLEKKINQVVLQNVPVTSCTYKKEQMEELKYRSKIEVENVRLVHVEGYDLCACCGTHVAFTGEIGCIKIVDAKRHKGGTRFTLLAGERAFEDYQNKHVLIKELSHRLSAKEEKILEAFNRQQEIITQLREESIQALEKFFELKTSQIIQNQKDERFIFRVEEGLTVDQMRQWITMWSRRSEKAFLLCTPIEEGYRYVFTAKEDLHTLGKLLNQICNGKGGGKEFYQGTISARKDEIEAFVKRQKI